MVLLKKNKLNDTFVSIPHIYCWSIKKTSKNKLMVNGGLGDEHAWKLFRCKWSYMLTRTILYIGSVLLWESYGCATVGDIMG